MLLIKKNFSKVVTTIIMGAFSLIFLVPLIWMISAAFKYEKDVMRFPIQWIPENINFIYNFQTVWMGRVPFYTFYMNSVKVALMTTIITIIISSLAAYALTKLEFRGRNLVFLGLLAFMIIPEQATLIPRFIVIRWLGLYDTHIALIFMSMFSIYFTFLLRQFMMGISNDYLEAAKIDGAGHFRTFISIMIPLCKPVLATVAIIKFIWTWNDYQNPLIFLLDRDLYTIPLGMSFFRDDFSNNYSIMMMAALSAIVPLVILFIALQKQVINGIALGGVKG